MIKLDYWAKRPPHAARPRTLSTFIAIIGLALAIVLIISAIGAGFLYLVTRLLFGRSHGLFGVPL